MKPPPERCQHVTGSVRDDPKFPDYSGEVPKPNKVVGDSIPDREIITLLDGKLVM